MSESEVICARSFSDLTRYPKLSQFSVTLQPPLPSFEVLGDAPAFSILPSASCIQLRHAHGGVIGKSAYLRYWGSPGPSNRLVCMVGGARRSKVTSLALSNQQFAASCKIVPEYFLCTTMAKVYVRLKVTHKILPESF